MWDARTLVIRAFRWPPSEIDALTFEEILEFAEIARMDLQ